jgi:hypothetical protein
MKSTCLQILEFLTLVYLHSRFASYLEERHLLPFSYIKYSPLSIEMVTDALRRFAQCRS